MIQKILVALDMSETSESVLKKAVELAKTTGAKLMLLQVISGDEEGAPLDPYYTSPSLVGEFSTFKHQWQEFVQTCLQKLQKHAAKAEAAGVNSEIVQKFGDPGRTICHLARDWKFDLIVMGRHGRSGLTELMLGSVSSYVVHHANCNTFVIQPT